MDLFIQNNFFSEPWQVAYVYDPKSHEDGLFIWKRGQATKDKFLIDPDTVNTDPPKAREGAVPTSGTLTELTERVQSLERRMRSLVAALVFLAVLAVLAPFIVHTWSCRRTRDRWSLRRRIRPPAIPKSLLPLLPAPNSPTTAPTKPARSNKGAPVK